MESDRLLHISSEVLVDNRGRAAGFHRCEHFGDLAPANRRRLQTAAQDAILPHTYTLTGDAARTIPSSLSSNSNPAVRGLWWRVYQR